MMKHKDLAPGLIILTICGILFYFTTHFETDPLGMTQGMPATRMPQLILGVISFLAVVMMVQGRGAAPQQKMAPPPWRMWASAAVLGLCATLFTTIGVPLAFFGVCIVIPILWGARNYRAVAMFAVVLPAAILIVFQGFLGLRLPLGPLSALGI